MVEIDFSRETLCLIRQHIVRLTIACLESLFCGSSVRDNSFGDHGLAHLADRICKVRVLDTEDFPGSCIVANNFSVPHLSDLGRVRSKETNELDQAEFGFDSRDSIALMLEVSVEDLGNLSPPERPVGEDKSLTLSFVILDAIDMRLGNIAYINGREAESGDTTWQLIVHEHADDLARCKSSLHKGWTDDEARVDNGQLDLVFTFRLILNPFPGCFLS